MPVVTWIGLGKMGLPMATHLLNAGHEVRGIEINDEAAREAKSLGITVFSSWKDAVPGADVVVTMLPTGAHVLDVLGGPEGIFATAAPDTVIIDSSTIGTTVAQQLHELAAPFPVHFLDAPVSGGVLGAANGTLTFMVGGTAEGIAAATPVLEPMGARIVHTGPGGTGQAAKIVNNMIFGVCLAATCEGVLLGERLGLDPAVFYEIATSSTSDNFPLRHWYPAPGVVPTAPSTSDYQPGFTSALLLKDLTLALESGEATGTPLASAEAVQRLYTHLVASGAGALDCTALMPSLAGQLEQPGTPLTSIA